MHVNSSHGSPDQLQGKESARNRGQTVVVTGASGMLGRHLCTHLLRRGWEVRALVRHVPSQEVPQGVPVGRCDLPETIDASLLRGASALVHCAYATRVTRLIEARRINEEGTRRILAASRKAGIPRFVFISSLAAYPEAPSYYARSKYALESLFDPNRDLVIRPGLILARTGRGLFQQMRELTQRTRVVPLFDRGRQPLQTVHVDDVCEAIARALERGLTGTLSIAEPGAVTISIFMRLLADRLRVRCLFLPLPLSPLLTAIRMIEVLRIPFPLRSESLLGLSGLRQVPTSEDLRRLDLVARSAEESLMDVV